MAKEFSVLTEQANVIKNEVEDGANTASRVGGMFVDVVEKIQDEHIDVVQELGDDEDAVMSQKTVSDNFNMGIIPTHIEGKYLRTKDFTIQEFKQLGVVNLIGDGVKVILGYKNNIEENFSYVDVDTTTFDTYNREGYELYVENYNYIAIYINVLYS